MLRDLRIIDLSLPIREGMFEVAGHENVSFVDTKTYTRDRFRTTALHMSAHAGTHIDYPAHLDPAGAAIGDDADPIMPACQLTPAAVLRFFEKRGTPPLDEYRWGDEITADEVAAAFDAVADSLADEAGGDPVIPSAAAQREESRPGTPRTPFGVIAATGWNDHWFDADFRRRGGPTLADDAVRLLLDRGARYLASDFTFTFEPGRCHDLVLCHPDGDRFLVEGLCNLRAIREPVVWLFVAPLKLVGREATPAQVYALEPSAR
jgi:kynurenine formamidase